MGDTPHFSLDQLAEAAGMTSRNIRAYQTRGLIPPPRRRGRHSVYGPEHLLRLRAIHTAREAGASLNLIGDHLARGGDLGARDPAVGWLSGGTSSNSGRAQRRTDLAALLAQRGMSDRARDHPAVEELLERLLGVGLLLRDGDRVLAGRELATSIAALHKHGLAIQTALVVALHAAEAAGALAEALREACEGLDAVADATREQAVDLAVNVLRDVLTAQFSQLKHDR